ncbi:MAG: HAD-IB family phosphatase [Fusobacteriaceae bacterium]|nr:HAD-IB family phosphatase [Fusobacteriaceae bacterium]
MLEKMGWEETVYKRLNDFIQEKSNEEYCVFDFDNTCVIHDIQEVTYNYMIDNLIFKMDKKNFEKNLKKKISGEEKIDSLLIDVIKDYAFLYDNYIFSKKFELGEIKKTEKYLDFAVKLRYLYKYIGVVYDDITRTIWGTYLFSGFTKEDFQKIGEEAVNIAFNETLKIEKLISKDGVEAIFRRGLRRIPEVEELIFSLRDSGRKVFIVSASHEELVKSYACKILGFKEEEVYGMRSKKDLNGIYFGEYEDKYPPTQNEGKSQLIKQFLVEKYGIGPSFVAGDSNGDFYMMTEFINTKLCLIIDRNLEGEIKELKISGNSKYLVQGRNEVEGKFINSKVSIELELDSVNQKC